MSDIYCAQCEGRLVGAWRRSQLPPNRENNQMDPNANLEEQRKLAQAISTTLYRETIIPDAERLAELVQALDKWLSGGGFLPKDWNKLCRDNS